MEIITSGAGNIGKIVDNFSPDAVITLIPKTQNTKRYFRTLEIRKKELNFLHHICEIHDVCAESQDYITPQKNHIKNIINFVKNNNLVNSDKKVLVHCYAGISRSTAVALSLYCLEGDDALTSFKKVSNENPMLSPNLLIIELFEDEIGDKGLYNLVSHFKSFIPQSLNLKNQVDEFLKELDNLQINA